jgi:hypothetical protein
MFTINTESGEITRVPLHMPGPSCPSESLVRVNLVETVPE